MGPRERSFFYPLVPCLSFAILEQSRIGKTNGKQRTGGFLMPKKIKVTIVKPAGNDTALVEGIPAKKYRKQINDKIMQLFPNVEQVGFYKTSSTPRLEMAGGEFCGNATRSFAYLFLKGKKGQDNFKASGVKELLNAGIKSSKTSFAQMPIYKSFDRVKQLEKDLCKVEIKGITHLITPLSNFSKENLKMEGKKLLKKYDLLQTVPASGVMFYTKLEDGSYKLDPIVWVRDIQSLFYETACASGTTAFGLMLSKQNSKSIKSQQILQPSGQSLSVSVNLGNKNFTEASIEGPVEILEEKEVVF